MLTSWRVLVGALLLVVARAGGVWPGCAAGALAAAGVGVLAVSWLVDARAKGKP